jgi:hypothetical protein
MGRGWFLGAIFIVSAATYLLAIYIGDILAFLVSVVNHVSPGVIKKPGEKAGLKSFGV